MVDALRDSFARFFHENIGTFCFVTILFIVGVVFGALAVNVLDASQQKELNGYLQFFYEHLGSQADLPYGSTFQHSLLKNMEIAGAIWFLGLTVVGIPIICGLVFLRGFIVGFSVGFLVRGMAFKGVLLACVSILPQNLIFVPMLLLSSITAIALSLHLARNRLITRQGIRSGLVMRYSLQMLVICCGFVAASFVEAYVTPSVMQSISAYLW